MGYASLPCSGLLIRKAICKLCPSALLQFASSFHSAPEVMQGAASPLGGAEIAVPPSDECVADASSDEAAAQCLLRAGTAPAELLGAGEDVIQKAQSETSESVEDAGTDDLTPSSPS